MRLLAALILLIATLGGCVNNSSAPTPQFPFDDGTTICFIGNSITQDGRYHKVLNTFYSTRYPGSDVRFVGCGVGGETAGDMIVRFERDVMPHRPDYAFLMTGMNDVVEELYLCDIEIDDEVLDAREEAISKYKDLVTQLVDMLQSRGITPILMTPTIYDQSAVIEREPQMGRNDALAICAQFIRQLGSERDLMVVDHYAAMSSINSYMQSLDPSLSIIGPDRVHPQNLGHFVMAYNILRQLHPAGELSSIEINADSGVVTTAVNCEVESVDTSDGLSFRVKHRSLPMPHMAGYDEAMKYVDFDGEYNCEMLRVKSLESGRYRLSIGGVVVDTLSSDNLRLGVNMSSYLNSPRYAEAKPILNIINDYSSISGRLRLIANVEYRLLKRYQGSDSLDERADYLAQLIEQGRGGVYYEFQLKQRKRYLELKPQEDSLLREQELAYRKKVASSPLLICDYALVKVE